MNEDELIARIRDLTRSPFIGDDAACWQPSRSHRSIITMDALVEGVHFRRDTMSPADAGWRAMVANLSDAAAAGARPVLATVALTLPKTLSSADALELYGGIAQAAQRYGCQIAGGDISRGGEIAISIALVGEVRAARFKGRAGARPGDVIAVTGPLGASRAGLCCAQDSSLLEGEQRDAALSAHRRPVPRIDEGRWLSATTSVHAMMDVSDGLSTDLARLCERSGCAALIENVPVAAAAAAAAAALGEDPQRFALAGGEDFELLVAVAARAFTHVRTRFFKRFGRELVAVGRIREGTGLCVRNGEREEALAPSGWDHLA